MHKRSTAALALLAAAVFPAVAVARPPTLHLTATVYDVHSSKGVVSSKEKVYSGTTKLGEDSSTCTKKTSSTTRCTGSYKLMHGTFTFSGTISSTGDTNRLAVTGGTGSYKGVRGTVLTEYNKAGTKAKETITFT
jgi:hypothetical protein